MDEMDVQNDTSEVTGDIAGNVEDVKMGDVADSIPQLEETVSANPTDYNAHLSLVQALVAAIALNGAGEDELSAETVALESKLEAAREAFAAAFPLSEQLWSDWLKHRRRRAQNLEEQRAILDVFKRAVKDYLSIPLYVSYVRYAHLLYFGEKDTLDGELSDDSDDDDEDDTAKGKASAKPKRTVGKILTLDEARTIGEDGIDNCAMHFTDGHLIWDACHEFEVKVLDQLPAKSKDRPAQVERIRTIFSQRLSTPHSALDATLSSYSSFESSVDSKEWENRMSSASKIVARTKKDASARQRYEEEVVSSGHALSAYFHYIDFEKKKGGNDPHRIRTLFERAVGIHCLDENAWSAYVTYLIAHRTEIGPDRIMSVCSRSVRNCPVSGLCWGNYMRVAEMLGRPKDEITTDIYLPALSTDAILRDPTALYILLSANIDMERRFLSLSGRLGAKDEDGAKDQTVREEAREEFRKNLTEAEELLSGLHPAHTQLHLAILLLRVRLEYTFLHSPTAYQTVSQLSKSHPALASSALFWTEWARLEHHLGIPGRARTVLKSASLRNTDDNEAVWSAWMEFERECGGIAEWWDMEDKVAERRGLAEARRAREEVQAAQVAEVEVEAKVVEKKKTKKGKVGATNADAGQDAQSGGAGKRKADDENEDVEMGDVGEVPGKPKRVRVNSPPPEAASSEASASKPVEPAPISISSTVAEPTTIFVKRLPLGITAGQLRREFSDFGTINDIRLVNRETTTFAYIEFATPEEASNAVSLDGKEMGGKYISVAISNPSLRGQGSAADQSKEDPCELFVRNLPFSYTEGDIRALFEPFGSIKSVRILTFPSGQSRGITFVEFEDEKSATNGLSLTGKEIGGRSLLVQKADRAVRGPQGPPQRGRGARGGASGGARGGGGRGRGVGRGGAAGADGGDTGAAADVDMVTTTPVTAFVPRAARPGLGARGRGRGGSAPHARVALGAPGQSRGAGEEGENGHANGAAVSSKSNDEFRKMFLKGDSL